MVDSGDPHVPCSGEVEREKGVFTKVVEEPRQVTARVDRDVRRELVTATFTLGADERVVVSRFDLGDAEE